MTISRQIAAVRMRSLPSCRSSPLQDPQASPDGALRPSVYVATQCNYARISVTSQELSKASKPISNSEICLVLQIQQRSLIKDSSLLSAITQSAVPGDAECGSHRIRCDIYIDPLILGRISSSFAPLNIFGYWIVRLPLSFTSIDNLL